MSEACVSSGASIQELSGSRYENYMYCLGNKINAKFPTLIHA